MPKDIRDPDLRGRNFKNQDLHGADFSGADIRGVKFTGANLAGANFSGARAGVRKRWMALQFCISFALCGLLDFVGILFAVVFTAFLLSPNFPQDTGFFPHIEMLLIQAGIYLTLARQGFTAKALTTITTFVGLVLAGAVAVALALALAGAGAGTSAVAVGVAGALAGALAVTFAGALALALALALTLAGTRAVAGAVAGAFVLAFALALAGAGALAGALARAIAGAGAGALALAGAISIAIDIAIAIAGATLLLSLYVAWRSSKEDEKFEPAHSLGVWLGVLGGTSVKAAILGDKDFGGADFTGATLNNCDFSHALVSRTGFRGAKGLKRARLKGTILGDKAVRDLLVTGRLCQQNYRGKNLQGANLAGANLSGADFTEAELSGAILTDTDLTGANLTKTQALGADFTRAKLTGACIESWNIDADTKFEHVNCDYIFQSEKPNAFSVRERLPHDAHKMFQPGDFEKLFKQVMDTVKILLRNGGDRESFNVAFGKLMQAYPAIAPDAIQAVERKGNDALVTLQVPKEVDKGAIEKLLDENYQLKLEAKTKAALLAKEEQHSQQLLEILKPPPKIFKANRGELRMGDTYMGDTYKGWTGCSRPWRVRSRHIGNSLVRGHG